MSTNHTIYKSRIIRNFFYKKKISKLKNKITKITFEVHNDSISCKSKFRSETKYYNLLQVIENK